MAQQGNQPLPAKEAGLLRQIVKFYESKQYKKGLKAADQILKNHAGHGETLAMKGLTLNCLDRKKEAYDHVRRGLKEDLKSHVCWHVYGLLYRSDREYREAIKCYTNALKWDKDNIQILRDMALLQIQMRDLNGFLETRNRLLQLRPGNRNNWIAFAIAHYLNKHYDIAVQVLTAYEGTLDDIPKEEAYEHSEMLLFKATLLEASSKLQEAREFLDASEAQIKDKLGWLEMKAKLLLRLEALDEAEQLYRQLLRINPDNYDYHRGLQAALNIQPEAPGKWSEKDGKRLSEVYAELQAEYENCISCQRVPLDFLEGEEFRSAVDAYVMRFLEKGIPSLFSDLKPLYRDEAKAAVLGELFEGYATTLRALGSHPESENCKNPSKLSPQARVWVLHYLAQHYDYLGQTERALACISEAVSHAPKLVELHSVQATILKHAKDMPGAALAADEARKLDLADRGLNSVAVKALFRAGDIKKAEKLAALFTKDGDQVNNLVDMQCMWYEIACGRAFFERKEYGMALKKFLAVTKHFADFMEDQFDFHGYCVRKMTLRSYIDLLEMEDELYGEKTYSKAAWGAIQCYLDLYDNPHTQDQEEQEAAILASMTADERKKYKNKKKKEAARLRKKEQKEKEEQEQQAKEKATSGKKGQSPAEQDSDPNGEQLAATSDPLGEATKLVEMLKEHASGRVASHKFAFEVYVRKKRMLLCLSAVQRACQLEGPGSPVVHNLVVRFCKAVMETRASSETPSSQEHREAGYDICQRVIDEGIEGLLGKSTLPQYVQWYVEEHASKSLSQRAAAAEMLALIQPDQRKKAVALVLEGTCSADGRLGPEEAKDCVFVHHLLEGALEDSEAAEEWMHRCRGVFLWSSYFKGPKRTAEANGVSEEEDKQQNGES